MREIFGLDPMTALGFIILGMVLGVPIAFRTQIYSYREFRGGKWIEARKGQQQRWFKGSPPSGWTATGMVHRTKSYARRRAMRSK